MNADAKPILVIGGGIAGITAAVEAAEVGCRVVLVEKEAYLGGRVVRMHRYFPKMCPPTCGFEINTRRLKNNPRITVHTLASVDEVVGEAGDFLVTLNVQPRYVTGNHPIDDSVAEELVSERSDEFNYGMSRTKALYWPHDMAYPHLQVLDRKVLLEDDAVKLFGLKPEGTINLDMTERKVRVEVGAIIIATGWQPYDAEKLDNLSFGQAPNVITNVMMERLAAPEGPTNGDIVRPSDGQKPKRVAFVQCAGSRDENHLPYCSAVCCMGSLKQVRYVRENLKDAEVTVFYIDIRTIGRDEKFYYDLLEDDKISFVKGKVAKISEIGDDHGLVLDVQDTMSRDNLHEQFDLVVLATGVVPTAQGTLPLDLKYDEYGFLDGTTNVEGVFAAGCARGPCDVSRTTKEATGTALKAIQYLKGGK